MCGICGVVSVDRTELIDPRVIKGMRDTLIHRGPDDAGCYVAPGVALGHRRLSIIDLRPEGRQPMANEDGSVQIVFNGEIYNFAGHRQWLISKGHRFRSRTDTEVIIHLYEELGVDCLKLLRGMFAFAIWDQRKRLLFIARDRLGQKPLFYRLDEKRLLFGSEAKAILAFPGITREADPDAIDSYMSLGYVPSPMSAFKDVCKLPAAHYLTYCSGKLEVRRYWQLHYRPKLMISEREACTQIIDRLTEAVRLRMLSDVPIGAFLSGGVDSSAIVALMAKLSSTPVKTFSIGFTEPDYDESRYARTIAQRFGTEHRQFTLEPDATEILDTLVWHYDEPYADSSALPTYYLSKLTRKYVAVALNGDAGDENFGGYSRYRRTVLANYLRMTPAWLRRLLDGTSALAKGSLARGSRIAGKLQTLKIALETDQKVWNARLMMQFNPSAKRQLYSDDFGRTVDTEETERRILARYDQTDAEHIVDSMLAFDMNLYLPDDLLVKVDIASMAVGLEARSPMVDHEFIEFVAQLPARFKISNLTLKAIFKKALRGLLPKAILRRPKAGFAVPLEHWFRGQLGELLYDTLLSRRSIDRGYFKRSYVETLIDAHVNQGRNQQNQLWVLLMLELWHRVHIDGFRESVSHIHMAAAV